jgi:hypothetical protein
MIDTSKYFNVEIYTYTSADLFNSFSQINYVQLNNSFPNFNSYSQNGQVLLYEPCGVQNGIYYSNRIVSSNSINDKTNLEITNTISNRNGILFFNRSQSELFPPPGSFTISVPTYQSDKYFGTDMVVQWETLNDAAKTRKITILYNNAPFTKIMSVISLNNINYCSYKNKEIYYYNKTSLVDSYSQVNYVQLSGTLPYYNSYSQNGQVLLYKEDGTQYGTYYTNRNIQTDSKNDIINLTITNTISNNNGILFFYRSLNELNSPAGTKTISNPTFLSGNYLSSKDMIIIWEVLDDTNLTRKITVLYN